MIVLYFGSTRPGGPPGSLPGTVHIYVSTLGDDGTFGPGVLVPELSSQYNELRTTIRRDGLELLLASDRPNGRTGLTDIWVSTRDSTLDPWSTPVSLGPTVNYPGSTTSRPSLSWDGTSLYFNSNRPGGFNAPAYLMGDIYVTTRRKFREDEADEEESRHRS